MTKAYDRVLTTLTYIRGPMINDWVNTQESNLIACYVRAERSTRLEWEGYDQVS